MSISKDQVQHVATLARLAVSDAEIDAATIKLNALLDHFEQLNAIDTEGIEPLPHAVQLQNVWQNDDPVKGLSREEALSNGAVTRAGLFIVPTILEAD